MPNNAYRRGSNFERDIVKDQESKGCIAIRSAGSHKIYDVISIRHGLIMGIQAKLSGYIKPSDRKEMKENAVKHKILPIMAYKEKDKKDKRKSHIVYKYIEV